MLRESTGNLAIIVRDDDPPGPLHESSIFIPYTRVIPQTVWAAPMGATWVDVSSGPLAYWGLLLRLWEAGEDFTILEHDVICRSDVIDGFESCPEPWCLHEYAPRCPCGNPECWDSQRNNLGCVRFRAELIRAIPDAVSSIKPELRIFSRLCDGLGANLRESGEFKHHWHQPGVQHFKGEQL